MSYCFKLQRAVVLFSGVVAALVAFPAVGLAQTTVFTYQGLLNDGDAPAGGFYAMAFRVFDAEAGGAQYGADYVLESVAVEDGLFAVDLDFGAGIFTASPRWLEIVVNGQPLTPRQEITATPFAQKCIEAASADYATSAGLAGPWQTDGVNVTYVDGNVGIGTAAPAQKLSVAGTIESTADGFMFPDGTVQATASTGGPGFWSPSGTNIFSNNAGMIGIGTSTPTGKLHVAGGPPWTTNGWTKSLAVNDATAIEFGFGAAATRYGIGASNNQLYFFSTPTESTSAAASYFMTADSTGRVGIGTLAPGAKLHLAGGMKIDGPNTLELGAGIPKETSAGKIGYQTFGNNDSLDIVGAGTTGFNRKINF